MIILVCGLGSAYTLVVICRLLMEGVPDKLNHFKTPTGVVPAYGLGEGFAWNLNTHDVLKVFPWISCIFFALSESVVAGGPFESVDWMFSRRSFYGGDVGSFDCLIRFMTGKPLKL